VTSSAPYQSTGNEVRHLAALKNQYLAQGFTFETDPVPGQVPAFLGSYMPDAIARKPGVNLAIEVRHRRTPATDLTLKEIRRLFDGHPDWQFVVAYASDDPLRSLQIAAPSVADVRTRLDQIRELENKGELDAAFVLGWSLLEATLNTIEHASAARPRTPGPVIQTLVMLGYVTPDTEKNVRPLITLRNRLVHGDLAAKPSPMDVRLVLAAVEEALSEFD
jgi:uncharacterized protein YutE (UPF0331/DUF86 family)